MIHSIRSESIRKEKKNWKKHEKYGTSHLGLDAVTLPRTYSLSAHNLSALEEPICSPSPT